MKVKKAKIVTPTQFADDNNLSRATVWRWLNRADLELRLKMYDARKVEVAGKKFIEIDY